MSRKPTIYWARPITTYSRTHLNAIEAHKNGEENLSDRELKLHCDLLQKCLELETKVHDLLQRQGCNVVDPGSKGVAEAFEAWRKQADENKANPMPFFTNLAEGCDKIIFTCFDDALQSENAPSTNNRIGCGVVKEVNAWAHNKNHFNVACLSYDYYEKDGLNIRIFHVDWPQGEIDGDVLCDHHYILQSKNHKLLTCLDYPQTKALLLLQGYKSRSSKHKSKDK